MPRPRFRKACLVALAALLPATAMASSAIKKWVDADGVTHYGTSIPPQYIDQPHTELNRRGITVKRVERAKTDQEIAREQELEELRKAQQAAIAEQRAKDRILLNMFRTEDDLIMTRDGKLEQVEAQIKLKKAHVGRLKERLAKWQSEAAKRERQGRQPTSKQLENLREIQQQLENTYASIVEKEAAKRRISDQYAYELKRFTQLKSGFRASSAADIDAPPEARRVIEVTGAYVCRDGTDCHRVWKHAKTWTRKHSSTPIEVVGDRILVTKTPTARDEISLTVSHLRHGEVERLFIDVNCHNSVAGRELCSSEPVQALRERFVQAMQAYSEGTAASLADE